MTEFTPIYLPQSGPNDVTAILVEWAKAAGDRVNAGETVAAAETTKSVFDIETPQAGHLYPLVAAGEEVTVGGVIAALSPAAASIEAAQAWLAAQQATPEPAQPRQNAGAKAATKKAELLAQRHGIDLAQVPAGGERITLYLGAVQASAAGPAPASSAAETAFRFEHDGNTSAFYWVDQGFGYALAGNLPRAELLALATLVYRSL